MPDSLPDFPTTDEDLPATDIAGEAPPLAAVVVHGQHGHGQAAGVTVWIMAALGLVFTLGTIFYLLYQATTEEPVPPTIEITIDSVTENGDGYLVSFRARNHGTITAEMLFVRGSLLDAQRQTVEVSEMVFDYLPAAAEQRGGLFFLANPANYELSVRPQGYQQP